MRPRSDIRRALAAAAAEVGSTGATWRDLAARACVGFDAARRTAENMHRAGELVVVGQRVAGAARPMNVYVAAQPIDPSADAANDSGVSAADLHRLFAEWRA